MSILEFRNTTGFIDYQNTNIGNLYFFKDFAVAEFDEGVNINYQTFKPSAKALLDQYNDTDFGVITNRINTYSLDLRDAEDFNNLFPNLRAYAVVCNSLFGRGNFEIENRFFKYNRKAFNELQSAIAWVKKEIKK